MLLRVMSPSAAIALTLVLTLMASSLGCTAGASDPGSGDAGKSDAGTSDAGTMPPAVHYTARKLGSEEAFSLDEVRGKAVLLTSWATWCGACRGELPEIDKLWQSDRDRGLLVVGVNVDVGGGDDVLVAFAQKKALSFPQVRDENNLFQATFGTVVVPESRLIDRQGALVEQWSGALDTTAPETAAAVEKALDEKP